jgi:hypothetical protein
VIVQQKAIGYRCSGYSRGDRVREEFFFEVTTALGFSVRVTRPWWEFLTTIKHPILRGREADVQQVLSDPDQVRRSRRDPRVFLFYRLERQGRWLCAVARRLNGDGFLVTAYPTDAIKEGEHVCSR